MKDKLTSADKPGWYLFRFTPQAQHDEAGYWDGENLLSFPGEEHDGVITGCSNFRRLTEVAEPEVIEGDGYKVLPAGMYWRRLDGAAVAEIVQHHGGRTTSGCRYIRIHEPHFPPRPQPIPPKPELVLVHRNKDSCPEWAFDRGDFVLCFGGMMITKSACWKVERQA